MERDRILLGKHISLLSVAEGPHEDSISTTGILVKYLNFCRRTKGLHVLLSVSLAEHFTSQRIRIPLAPHAGVHQDHMIGRVQTN